MLFLQSPTIFVPHPHLLSLSLVNAGYAWGPDIYKDSVEVYFLTTILLSALPGVLPTLLRCSVYLQIMQLYLKKNLLPEESMEYVRFSRQL